MSESFSIVLSQSEVASDPVLESFVSYYASVKKIRLTGDSAVDLKGKSVSNKESSTNFHLQQLVRLLSEKVENNEFVCDAAATVTDSLAQYRTEVDITDVYKGRIVDLQKVINGTKLPGELDALIGRQELVVPIGAESTVSQLQREAVHDVSRLAGKITDMNERYRAQNALLSSQVAGLLAENALLMDRVSLLEEQVSALGNSAAVTLRELNKVRQTSSAQITGTFGRDTSTSRSSSAGKVLRPSDTVVAGVVMDKETALWLREVYLQLTKGVTVDDAIKKVREKADAPFPRPYSSTRKESSPSQATTPFSQFVSENRLGTSPGNK